MEKGLLCDCLALQAEHRAVAVLRMVDVTSFEMVMPLASLPGLFAGLSDSYHRSTPVGMDALLAWLVP